jgi:hypothetical protein
MAEHILRPRNPDHRVVVGWDNALQTFFAKVTDRSKRDCPEVASLGTYEREIIDIIDFRKRVHRFGYFGEADRKELLAQREAGRAAP